MAEETLSIAETADRLREHTGNGCFACGLANPIGLHVDGFTRRGGDIAARFNARPDYQGTIGTLHGGVSAAALDEILVWAGIIQEGVLTVTAKLELRYRRPVTGLGGVIELRGRVDERRGRRLSISGELLEDGAAAVSASGLYLVSHTVEELAPPPPGPSEGRTQPT